MEKLKKIDFMSSIKGKMKTHIDKIENEKETLLQELKQLQRDFRNEQLLNDKKVNFLVK